MSTIKPPTSKLARAVLLSGKSNTALARKIAKELGLNLGKMEVKQFSDGESYVHIDETLKDQAVYIIQSGSYPANHYLMELLAIVHAARGLQPKKLVVVIPFFPYRRMEKVMQPGEALMFELVANLLHAAGIDKIICMDLHKHRSKRFFKFQRKELLAFPLIIERLKRKKLQNFVVVAPDKGSMPASKRYARELGVPLVKSFKTRKKHDEAIIKRLEGDVLGKDVFIIDDEINTAGTLTGVVEKLKQQHARNIYFACTHAVLSGPAIERLQQTRIREVIVTDTIELPELKRIPKIKVVSVAKLFAQAIRDDR
ncbi:MAG: ribose-phosphate pyrophosphokinase [Candidatus Kerfeldbacteria bacterium]|nr:ribose-phosphate pyrophosphokinase [Candidatus Kerfeldbacteria bacterium]